MSTVLVTGGSGFIGGHCILQLMAAGHQVRTTVRNLGREPGVRAMLRRAGPGRGSDEFSDWGARLSFFAADLTSDAGWSAAVAGCDYVLHVASPFPTKLPKDENELIVPAREGALRVLRAARDAGVKRVVMTSSFAAIGYGHPQLDRPFVETDWSDVDSGRDMTPYAKSKTLAERAAWDFMAAEGGRMELAVVNPVGVFGPVLGPDLSTSVDVVRRMLDGRVPGYPRYSFGIVDVRDVADLHLRCMTNPAAAGQRFLAVVGDFMSLAEIAKVLKAGVGEAAQRVPTREMPDWLIRIAALWDPSLKWVLPELGKHKEASGEKARKMLGWSPRSREEAIMATGESLVQLGFIRHSPKKAA